MAQDFPDVSATLRARLVTRLMEEGMSAEAAEAEAAEAEAFAHAQADRIRQAGGKA